MIRGSAIPRKRIAVVSPFIDKRHGTERRVAECISRLAEEYEFHIYSNRVEDLDLSRVIWHRIPALPGPHLFAYLWWFAANHLWRWRDRRFRGLTPAVVYSPGINCFDADVVTVHVIFTEFSKQVREGLRFQGNPARSWMRLVHRRLYYGLIRLLESRIYTNPHLTIGAISQKISSEMQASFGREERLRVIYQGIDHDLFNPQTRMDRRQEMRRRLGLSEDELALLLIGNGWKNKGLPCVLAALSLLREIPCKLLVVGSDDRTPYASLIAREGLQDRVKFLQPSADVVQFYAAADVYVGPSLYDSFAQPPMEAMACGLPVITSSRNGGSEIIAGGIDGLVMRDAEDPQELAGLVLSLRNDPAWCRRMGEMAAEKARSFTWEDNASHMHQLFEHVQHRKDAVGLISSPGRT